MKKNNRYKILFVFMSFSFLCGCWDIKGIERRVLPVTIGISKENDEAYKLTLQIPVSKNENKLLRIVTGKGDSVSNALGQMRIHSEEALDYSQIRLVIIQNNLAKNKEQLSNLIKFLMKSKEIPAIALLAITDDNIEKLLSYSTDKLGISATSYYDYFNKGASWAPEVSSTSIWEVYRSLFSYTKDIAIPFVSSGQDTVLSYGGSAILKNGEMTERISPIESQLVNLFQNHSANGKVESLGFASIMITSSSIQNKPSMKKNNPLMSSECNLKIDILEKKEGVTNNQIQKELKMRIEKRFDKMFEQAQKSHTDIFGFGQYFRHQIPYQELKNWREDYYPKLIVSFQVNASIN